MDELNRHAAVVMAPDATLDTRIANWRAIVAKRDVLWNKTEINNSKAEGTIESLDQPAFDALWDGGYRIMREMPATPEQALAQREVLKELARDCLEDFSDDLAAALDAMLEHSARLLAAQAAGRPLANETQPAPPDAVALEAELRALMAPGSTIDIDTVPDAPLDGALTEEEAAAPEAIEAARKAVPRMRAIAALALAPRRPDEDAARWLTRVGKGWVLLSAALLAEPFFSVAGRESPPTPEIGGAKDELERMQRAIAEILLSETPTTPFHWRVIWKKFRDDYACQMVDDGGADEQLLARIDPHVRALLATGAAPASPHLAALARELDAAWEAEGPTFIRSGEAGNAAVAATGEIVERIAAAPAMSLGDLLVKAKALAWCWAADDVEAMLLDGRKEKTAADRLLCAIVSELLAAA
ncbi:MAG: hypothetical protein AB7P02_27515 [Alphaproteobacteria bacterium]